MTEEARAQQGIPDRETVEQAAAVQSGSDPAEVGAQNQLAEAPSTGIGVSAPMSKAAVTGNGNGAESSANDHAASKTAGANTKRRPRGSGGTKGAPNTVKKLMWAGVVSGSMPIGTL